MIGVVVIAHEPLASAMVAVARHVYTACKSPEVKAVHAIDVPANGDVAAMFESAKLAIQQVDQGYGVLVITDILGATPGNIASLFAGDPNVSVVAGLSLPMLLKSLCYREQSLTELTAKAVNGGTHGVILVQSTCIQQQSSTLSQQPHYDQARVQNQQ